MKKLNALVGILAIATPTRYATLILLLLFSFPAYSQFKGGSGGGSDKSEIRTQTILSVENEKQNEFFKQFKISSQSNSFLIEWNNEINLRQIEIIDILGRVQKTVSISEFQKTISIPFDKTKGIYFVRCRDEEGRFFSKKIIF